MQIIINSNMLKRFLNKKGIWRKTLNKSKGGLLILAPMADVTDIAFRQIIARHSNPDMLYTEFVSADGLAHPTGRKRLLEDLKFRRNEGVLIAQIFSGDPKNMESGARLVQKLGFDGVDINTGCPSRNITKQLCGSELIKKENREIARKVIAAAKRGAPKLDVAVKTRLGWNEIDMSWIQFLLEQDIAALTVHLRTRKEMSKVPAHWELMTEIREMRDRIAPNTLILGNGDIRTSKQAHELIEKHGIDGVMIGRGIFSNPMLFDEDRELDKKERLELFLEHLKLYDKAFGENKRNVKKFGKRLKSFYLMKKFLKVYVNGFDGAKELRHELMQINESLELQERVKGLIKEL